MHALILAAGHGTRLMPYTEHRAKPSLPFLNIPLIGFSLFHLEQSGLSHLTVNTHHAPETIKRALSQIPPLQNYKVSYSDEQPQILGSGGAVKFAQDTLSNNSDPFIYANGDEVMLFEHDRSYLPLLEAHKKSNAIATMMLCEHPDVGTIFNGVWLNSENKLQRFGKKDFNDGTKAFHFTGVMVLSPRIFDFLPNGKSNILHDGLIPALQAGEHVLGHIENNLSWFETGNPAGYLSAQATCLKLLSGPTQSSQTLKKILTRFSVTTDIQQHPSSGSYLLSDSKDLNKAMPQFKGGVCIGSNVSLGENCQLENCLVESGVSLPDNTQVKDTLVLNADLADFPV